MKFLHGHVRQDDAANDLPPLKVVSLNFKDVEWERSYKAAMREGNLQQVRSAFLIGIALNTVFAPIDYFGLWANAELLSLLRLLGLNALLMVCFALSYMEYWRTRWPGLIMLAAVEVSAFQAFSNVYGGHPQPADTGFILMIFIIYSLFPLFYIQAVVSASTCTILFLAMTLPFAVGATETTQLVASSMLIISANVVGLFAARRLELLRRRAFARSVMIDQERNKVRDLLDRILPATVAQRLREGNGHTTERLPDVAVLFADLQDFTTLAASCEPEETLTLLSDVFEKFDALVVQHGVEKIKTIGDAYMVASGAPPGSTSNIRNIAALACDMIRAVEGMTRPDGTPLGIRIGISSGPIIAGVVGDSRFLYDLWGDPVNTASRMETTGESGRIQVTHDVVASLGDAYLFEPRGEIEIKGKGRMQTWWMTSAPEQDSQSAVAAE
ncbi:MAG: adenylate/guanylate cyclase domain-containing protein [Minwuia sp.]|nr:adenylate/guanylate cyclase domain-containing protein [Minwuia sp.]